MMTRLPYPQVVLYSNNTWKYVRNREVAKDSTIFEKYWDTKTAGAPAAGAARRWNPPLRPLRATGLRRAANRFSPRPAAEELIRQQ